MELIDLFITKFYKDFQEYTYKNKVLLVIPDFTFRSTRESWMTPG